MHVGVCGLRFRVHFENLRESQSISFWYNWFRWPISFDLTIKLCLCDSVKITLLVMVVLLKGGWKWPLNFCVRTFEAIFDFILSCPQAFNSHIPHTNSALPLLRTPLYVNLNVHLHMSNQMNEKPAQKETYKLICKDQTDKGQKFVEWKREKTWEINEKQAHYTLGSTCVHNLKVALCMLPICMYACV